MWWNLLMKLSWKIVLKWGGFEYRNNAVTLKAEVREVQNSENTRASTVLQWVIMHPKWGERGTRGWQSQRGVTDRFPQLSDGWWAAELAHCSSERATADMLAKSTTSHMSHNQHNSTWEQVQPGHCSIAFLMQPSKKPIDCIRTDFPSRMRKILVLLCNAHRTCHSN